MDANRLIPEALELKQELFRLHVHLREYVESLREGKRRDDAILAMAFARGAENLVDRVSCLIYESFDDEAE